MSIIERLNELARQSSLIELPIGVYVITIDGRFVNCNRRGREILQLPLDAPLSASILDYYDFEEREKLSLELEGKRSGGPELWLVKLRRLIVNGQEKFVKEYVRSIVGTDTSTIIGYLCCMTDVTDEEQYAQKIEELTHDIGNVLHTYSAALVTMNNAINAILESFEFDPFKQTLNLLPDQASAELEKPVRSLSSSINLLIDHFHTDAPILLDKDRLRLSELVDLLQNYQERVPYPEFHPSTLRNACFEVLNILNKISLISTG